MKLICWPHFLLLEILKLRPQLYTLQLLGYCLSSRFEVLVTLALLWISVRTVLCEGGVPQRPVVFVTRKKLVNAIQQKLFKLNGEPGWVTVYGMAGCGKTVLAAEAVRDHDLLESKF